MAIEVPRPLVEFILLGPEDDRRQLQDSPILGDVWIEYARKPGARLELLITPYKDQPAGNVATTLDKLTGDADSNIAYLQGIVAASLTLEEVLRFVVPMTSWWSQRRMAQVITEYLSKKRPKGVPSPEEDIDNILDAAAKWLGEREVVLIPNLDAHKRYAALAGIILWAKDQPAPEKELSSSDLKKQFEEELRSGLGAEIAKKLRDLLESVPADQSQNKSLVWIVALNRRATPALTQSVPSVKADAARTLFRLNCSQIAWAVVDSGIDATHDAFSDEFGKESRIKRSFDFTRIREIVSLDNLKAEKAKQRIAQLLDANLKLKNPPAPQEAAEQLELLAEGARRGRAIDWELVERLIEIQPTKLPASHHGTHVAGILGADRRPLDLKAKAEAEAKAQAQAKAKKNQGATGTAEPGSEAAPNNDWCNGMCPDIQLYDFRVLAPSLAQTEFAIIAALQYIRYINERNSYMTIHGANLSLSIRHDVRNYACGRTPICNECERLVNSGVVVVAAAGNRGYQNFETKEGLYESYAAFSVTDPGNADGVITVGSTHGYWPHTYGVSFFSSRGPTGDGRLKPDLVAPGERIRAPLPGNVWGDLDGTSMAAPHVSGAAAMLMSRYSELVGQPRRIKKILCESATDLGRERTFQGHGMLDVLRAFQSI